MDNSKRKAETVMRIDMFRYREKIPESVFQAAQEALRHGIDVDAFEDSGLIVIDVWTPWASAFAKELRKTGFRDGYMDQFMAETNPSQQMMVWQFRTPKTGPAPRLFKLMRKQDVSGVSGVGHVADGVRWHDGTATVHWRTEHTSTTVYANMEALEKIHGHGGATVIEWRDEVPAVEQSAPVSCCGAAPCK